jgi:hypothetical protein
MFDSQSKTFILLHPPVPQAPLLLHPEVEPFVEPQPPVEHDLHPIKNKISLALETQEQEYLFLCYQQSLNRYIKTCLREKVVF